MADPGWSDLPSDLLLLIFQTLTDDIPDLLRAAAACSSWRRAFADLRLLPPRPARQTPWLMFHGVEHGDPTASHFYSLSEKRIYTLPLPDPPIRTRLCIGSSLGWLITADERAELHLLNPITGAQISLPPIRTLHDIAVSEIGGVTKYGILGNSEEHYFFPEKFRSGVFEKAVMSCTPLEGDCVVMLIHSPEKQLSYARPGDERWISLTMNGSRYYDCIYHGGLFYTIAVRGCIQAWDLSGPSPQSKIIVPHSPTLQYSLLQRYTYLVQAPWGDLLQVWRDRQIIDEDDNRRWAKTVRVLVCRLVTGRRSTMEKMTSLGDHALFLGSNRSFCLPTKDFPCLKPDCVYLTDDDLEMAGYEKEEQRDVGIYHLKDDTCEHILPPNALLNWPPPIWITPSLA